MRALYTVLLVFVTVSLLAQESFTKPVYDVRLDRDSEAVEWYNNADTDSDSAYNIGHLYQTKIGDLSLAEFWYKQALNLNYKDTEITFNLAMLYEDEKKYNEAITWYKKAYVLEDTKAPNNLGYLYDTVLNDTKNAKIWYIKAIKEREFSRIKKPRTPLPL
ncbi:MAG: hypothetical protein COB42_05285 [Sulfurimonas sp.]|nr:MAG: hypothetical protein COB42_05285 [Sulfurimonas sp.]